MGASEASTSASPQKVPAQAPCAGLVSGRRVPSHGRSHAARMHGSYSTSTKRSDECFNSTPRLLPILERVEALLLHPFLASGPRLSNWASISEMLSTGRRPGICSFGELCSDAETLLAISLREDPGRTSAMPLPRNTILSPALSVLEAAEAAAQHSQEACREAAARICSNHSAIVSFACCGRGCGRRTVEARKMAEAYPGHNPEVDLALRQVVESLLRACRDAYPSELESAARRAARSAAALALAPLRFLSQNIGVPRDMAALPAGALRAHLRLHLAAKTSSAWAWGMPWGASAGQSGAQPHQHRRRRARRARRHSRGTSGVAPTGGLALTSGAQWRACLQVSVAKAKRCACSIRLACRDEQWCILSLLLAKFIALTTNFSYIGVGVLENLCLMLNTHVRTHTAVFSSRHCTSCRRLSTLPFSAAVPPSSKPEAEFCERWVE